MPGDFDDPVFYIQDDHLLSVMAGKRKFDEQIAALEALKAAPDEMRITALRKALGNRNNFLVGKAADLVRECRLEVLIPDLLNAFDRFFDDAEKSDAQCWAKNAISRALSALEYQEPEPFLRGMRHIQMEPVWGGTSDTAGTLRSTCAFALVQCRSIREPELLSHLLELLGDADKSVRIEAARAIEQVGSPSAALLLRLRVVLKKDEPEVLGSCYAGILNIEGVRAIAWLKRFLASADDSAAEVALAVAGTHSPEAFDCLKAALNDASDPWWRSVLLSAIALTRQDAATAFLLVLVHSDSRDAEAAIDALVRAAPSPEVLKRLGETVQDYPRLSRHLASLTK